MSENIKPSSDLSLGQKIDLCVATLPAQFRYVPDPTTGGDPMDGLLMGIRELCVSFSDGSSKMALERDNALTRADELEGGMQQIGELCGVMDIDGMIVADMVDLVREKVDYAVSLQSKARAVVEALADLQCRCTLRERDSGHLVGCPVPQQREVIDALEDALPNGENEIVTQSSGVPPGGDTQGQDSVEAVKARHPLHAVVPQLGPIWMPSAPLIEKLANLRERVDAIEPADHAGADDLERIVADLRAIEAELRECPSQVPKQEPTT